MLDEKSDAEIVTRCQLGDTNAWDVLVERWHPKLWRYVARMLVDDGKVDDVLQDIWMRVIRSLVRLRDPMRLAPWMYRVARLAVMDHLRVLYRRPPDTELVDVSSDDDGIENLFNSDEIEVALAELHPIDREAVVLFYFEQRSVAEIASICHVPAGTIKSRLHRARREIRDVLSTEEASNVRD